MGVENIYIFRELFSQRVANNCRGAPIVELTSREFASVDREEDDYPLRAARRRDLRRGCVF